MTYKHYFYNKNSFIVINFYISSLLKYLKNKIIPLILILEESCGQSTSNVPKNQSENPTSEDTSNSQGSNKTETSNSQNNDDTNTN